MTVDHDHAVYLAKRMLVDSIWKEAHIEVPGITFPNTQEIFDGHISENIDLHTVLVVNNLKHAWEYLLKNIDKPSDIELVCSLNREIGNAHLIAYAGYIRKFSVGISGTNYVPEIPDPNSVQKSVESILGIADPTERAFTAFCRIIREQWFPDGNKRTAQLWANHILIQSGVGILSVPVDLRSRLGNLLIDFYETDDPDNLCRFLEENCITKVDEEFTVTSRVYFSHNVTVKQKANVTVNSQIIAIIQRNPNSTAEMIANELSKSVRTVRRYLALLSSDGVIKRVGSDRTGHWEVVGGSTNGGVRYE